ncbi:MAG: hypothetical protein JWL61_5406, partial [Gemmatimonadetes bacterium]|nr:hypothetical protein [Gemmatimonadota bacterium]
TRLDFSLANNVGLGVSRDFGARHDMFRPRVTLSYDQWVTGARQTTRVGSLVGEAMFLPGELVRNVRPYLFGGLGLFSRLPTAASVVVGGSLTRFDVGAFNYVGWSSGLGVEVGRAFVQYRLMAGVGYGLAYSGLNLGYRL